MAEGKTIDDPMIQKFSGAQGAEELQEVNIATNKYDLIGEEEKQDIEHAIEAMHAQLTVIISEIKDSILNGEYSTVIGDDACGRLPALIISRVITNVYGDSLPKPKTLFFAGSKKLYEQKKEQREDALRTKSNSITDSIINRGFAENIQNGKTLVVTDTIHFGGSLVPLSRSLKELGGLYDVATLSLLRHGTPFARQQAKERIEGMLSTKVIVGVFDEDIPVYARRWLSGVIKDDFEVHSKSLRGDPKGVVLDDEMQNLMVAYSRKMAKELADTITKELFREPSNKEM